MNRLTSIVCAAMVLMYSPADAQSPPQVSIAATDPAEPIVLAANEPLYIRIAYSSDVPLRFQARGWVSGSEQPATMNPAPSYPSGEGEAIAWIAFRDRMRIDEIRVEVFDQGWNEQDSIRFPIDASWTGARAARRTPAPWATLLNDRQQAMVRSAAQNASGDTGGWIEEAFILLLSLATLSIPAYWILQVHVWRRYRDEWRKRALRPLWVTGPLLAYTLFALAAGSNLWPLMMIFITPFAFIYLVSVMIAKRRMESSPT